MQNVHAMEGLSLHFPNLEGLKNEQANIDATKISTNFHLIPTIELIKIMKVNPGYLPTEDQRMALYVCQNVLKNIASNQQGMLDPYTGHSKDYKNLKKLKLNTNISYNMLTKSLRFNDSTLLSNFDVEWAMGHLYELAAMGKPALLKDDNVDVISQNAEWRKWAIDVAQWVNGFLDTYYPQAKGEATSRNIDGQIYEVKRPNHGLAHAMRTAFLAVDIVDAFVHSELSGFKTVEAKNNAKAIKAIVDKDPYFRQKILMAAAYQRTARVNEGSSAQILQKDAINFAEKARQLVAGGKIFKNEGDFLPYEIALKNSCNNFSSSDSYSLENMVLKIISAAHMLDMKRLANQHAWNPNTQQKPEGFKRRANYFLGKDPDFIERLWKRTEKYLEVTGDRPEISSTEKMAIYQNKFYVLSQDPVQIVDVLLQTKAKMDEKEGY